MKGIAKAKCLPRQTKAAAKEKDLSHSQCSTLLCEQQKGGKEEEYGGHDVND
jgi:hypothetical protein